jgi:peptide deformylase
MPVRPIVYSDNAILRRPSHEVRQVSPAVQKLIADMVDTMHSANGMGLAAIQIGVPERVIVVELPPETDDEEAEDDDAAEPGDPQPRELIALVNPEIKRASRDVEEGIEGCLSVAGFVGEVERHVGVVVKALDVRGKPVRLKADGLLARVLQHEIDHCNGILFIDRIEDPDKIFPVARGTEEEAERQQALPDQGDEAEDDA